MDHYEELGIAPNASEEEIRRAYRRMTKLLHPDQQTDEGVKQLAEVQMRRLNMIVDVLLDPERRLEYDRRLRDDLAESIRAAGAGTQRRKSIAWPWWILSTAAAIALTVLVVWFWANHVGSSFGNHPPTYIPDKDAPASAAEVTMPPASLPNPQPANPPATVAPPMEDKPTVVQTPVPLKEQTAETAPTHKALVLPPAKILPQLETAPANTVNAELPPPPGLSVPSASHPDPLPIAALPTTPLKPPSELDPLAGEWVYAPTQPEKKKAGFYPPEFIDLQLVAENGSLHGKYRARYQVNDKPISPDVDFVLSPDSQHNRFTWEAANGSKGMLTISPIDANVIRIEWKTTVFSRKPALTAGTATLVKRGE